ncbi:MAG: amidotransferase, partial [Halobacteria archaeon]|nr:amidotransferase [Halobacteria archaeon]
QAFVYRNAVGLQFHLESTRRTAERLVEESEVPDGDYVQDPDEMLSRDFGVLEENAVKLLDGIENTVSR